MSKELEQLFEANDVGIIEELSHEYGKLMDWFEEEYPNGHIRLDVNSDQRIGVLTYKLSVLSPKDMGDQVSLYSEIVIDRDKFHNSLFMMSLVSAVYINYKTSITKSFNEQYNKNKEKAN